MSIQSSPERDRAGAQRGADLMGKARTIGGSKQQRDGRADPACAAEDEFTEADPGDEGIHAEVVGEIRPDPITDTSRRSSGLKPILCFPMDMGPVPSEEPIA